MEKYEADPADLFQSAMAFGVIFSFVPDGSDLRLSRRTAETDNVKFLLAQIILKPQTQAQAHSGAILPSSAVLIGAIMSGYSLENFPEARSYLALRCVWRRLRLDLIENVAPRKKEYNIVQEGMSRT